MLGGGVGDDINFSPFLASISLVFPACHALGLQEGRQQRRRGSGRCSFLLCLPYSFSPTHLVLPCPSEDQEQVPGHVPSDGPVPDVSSRSPHGACHSPLCPDPATYTPNPHCQQNPRNQGCCNSRNHTVSPFFFIFGTSTMRKRNSERPKHALPRHLLKLQQQGC